MGRRTEPAVADAEQVEEPTELVARAAAIDVAKDSGMVCTRVPHETRAGRKVQKTWSMPARYHDIIALGDHLRCQGIERVVLESTDVIRGSNVNELDIAQVVPWRRRL